MSLDWRKKGPGANNKEPTPIDIPARARAVAEQRAAAARAARAQQRQRPPRVETYTDDIEYDDDDEIVMRQPRRIPRTSDYYDVVPVQQQKPRPRPRQRKREDDYYEPRRSFWTWKRIKFIFSLTVAILLVLAAYSVILSVQQFFADKSQQFDYGQYQVTEYRAVVGHKDSRGVVDDATHKSFFIAFDDNGQAKIVEYPRDDSKAARTINGPILYGEVPGHPFLVELSFGYYSSDGRVDMLVTVAGSKYVVQNNGTTFGQ